ncbi:MAG TPA: hypothetical protein VJ438_05825, partial [Candidatus Nanoarchaeia archaeon]|nr:hypothetical protein [Candidatus Nanoarchaeia archaeon]
TRLVGGAEVSVVDFRIIVNGEVANIISPEDKSLEELDTKTYVVGYDIETGDTVKAAPVVQTGENQQMTCDIVGETKAI